MRNSIGRWVGVGLLLAGCGSRMDAETGGAGETESATTGTSTPTGTGSTGAGETTGATGSTDATPTTGEPVDCSYTACLTRISYDYGVDPEGDPCPGLVTPDCGGPALCGELVIKNDFDVEDYKFVETEESAKCILAAMRDRTKGRVSITWGDPQGFFDDLASSVHAEVQILGDETVLISWDLQQNFCACYNYARSKRVLLQPASFFAACLMDPTTQSLIDCFTAGSEALDPAPAQWMPPWTLGQCDDTLPVECP